MTPKRQDSVICPRCGDLVAVGKAHCGAAPILDGRYLLLGVVGHGAIGTTYEALRVEDGDRVAVKEMLVRHLDSAKAFALFEREAAALRELDHPGIPNYVDDFTWGDGKNVGLYLVQEFIDGETLAEESAARSYSTQSVLEIARELLEILDYIHGCNPPRIHRDLKPGNIMRRASDGKLMLIDFGSVRQAVQKVSDGSTISGTIGYMAPEQLYGQASAETDMYGLGMTLVALRTGADPFTLVTEHSRDWLQKVKLDRPLSRLVRALTHPDPSDRPSSGKQAIELMLADEEDDAVKPMLRPANRAAVARQRGTLSPARILPRNIKPGVLIQAALVLTICVVAVGLLIEMGPGGMVLILFVLVVAGLLSGQQGGPPRPFT